MSPAWAALEMVEAIVFNKRKIMPACVLLEGEYGVNGLFVGVPVILGRNGVESVVVLDLAEAERAAFERSAAAVPKTMDEVTTVKQAPH